MDEAAPLIAGNAPFIVTETVVGDSGMARRMRTFDWASSPIATQVTCRAAIDRDATTWFAISHVHRLGRRIDVPL